MYGLSSSHKINMANHILAIVNGVSVYNAVHAACVCLVCVHLVLLCLHMIVAVLMFRFFVCSCNVGE